MLEENGKRYCDRCGVELTNENNKCGYELCDKCNDWLNAECKEPTTKNDCISRTAAIKGLGEQPYVWTDSDYEIQQLADWKTHKEMLENLPSVTLQEPRKGHWIAVHPLQPNDEGDYICSVCRCGGLTYKPTKFCPNCGVKMVEPQESEADNGNDNNN